MTWNPIGAVGAVGSILVRWLLAGLSAEAQAGTPGDVYPSINSGRRLECRAELAPYYRRFGFEPVDWVDLPAVLELKFGLGRLLSLLPGVSIVSMRKTATR